MDGGADTWLLVVNGDPTSKAQMEVCRAHRGVGPSGFIECDAEENRDAPICATVDYFPAFCNTKLQTCTYGRRDTRESLAELKTLAPSVQTRVPEPRRTSTRG